jgi:UDP-N-acetylglucosamine 2-epimerase (non-hydrolysing)/GDP/UDP-N,N'-diacetylbacillosamine 2-epimerase (hydrolysing)
LDDFSALGFRGKGAPRNLRLLKPDTLNPEPSPRTLRNVCFVTGTRAEFGLMRSTLSAIRAHEQLQLQLIVTGMHLDRAHGRSLNAIRAGGWSVDRIVPWKTAASQSAAAAQTGAAMGKMAAAFEELESDVVLVVGDRVEAFAAAAAAHISGRIVAHVHGGDRALGLVDDSLRHSITKLAHVHFPATMRSAQRIARLGEDRWRIHRVGSPGLDDLSEASPWEQITERFPSLRRRRYALLVLHPSDPEAGAQRLAAEMVLGAVESIGIDQTLIVHPNNDPGSDGIRACWQQAERAGGERRTFCLDLPRPLYLGLLRDAAFLIGNSSSGIIEAASFGTMAIDVGPRQSGRERGANVVGVALAAPAVRHVAAHVWNDGRPRRFRSRNIYGKPGAGRAIAEILSQIDIARHLRKLIAY